MEIEPILTQLLIAWALTCAFWVCLPDALFLLGLTRVRRGVLGGPEDVQSGPVKLVTEEIARQLEVLGFAPAGLYWEYLPAHKFCREVIFVSPTRDCFAAVYRLFNNDPPRVAFKTAFSDGAFVLTQNYAGGTEANEETLRTGGLYSEETIRSTERFPLAEVLEENRRRVQRFVLAGHALLPAVTIDDHVEAERIFMDQPTVRRELRTGMAVGFSLKLAFLAGGPGLLAFLGVGPGIFSALLLVESLAVLLFRYHGFPLLVALERMLPAEEKH
jgi:hypothetical protein